MAAAAQSQTRVVPVKKSTPRLTPESAVGSHAGPRVTYVTPSIRSPNQSAHRTVSSHSYADGEEKAGWGQVSDVAGARPTQAAGKQNSPSRRCAGLRSRPASQKGKWPSESEVAISEMRGTLQLQRCTRQGTHALSAYLTVR